MAQQQQVIFRSTTGKRALALSTAGVLAIGAFSMGRSFLVDLPQVRAETPVATPATKVDIDSGTLARLDDFSKAMRAIGHAVEPSVVDIQVRKKATANALSEQQLDLFKRMFPDTDGDGEPDVPGNMNPFGEGGNPGAVGQGSGVIVEVIGKRGFVLTNNHVAGGADEIRVTLADGRVIENAKVVGTDRKTDLAVIEIEAENLVASSFGDSDQLERGDIVVAFGAPFGYVGSMTQGIISGMDRQSGILGSDGYEYFIQTDAAINPGNSGGPLVNIQGQIVGINTAIATRSGSFSGIGFAIPVNQAKFVFEQLRTTGKVTRGWLGVSISDVAMLTDAGRKQIGFVGREGIYVGQTIRGTPAFEKLLPEDVITHLDGIAMKNNQQLRMKIAAAKPGTEIALTVFREGKNIPVKITLGEQPEETVARGNVVRPNQAEAAGLGLRLQDPTETLLKQNGLPEGTEGAVIGNVATGTPGATAGLEKGDVIARVNGKDVANAKEATEAIKAADLKEGVRLRVINRDGVKSVTIQTK